MSLAIEQSSGLDINIRVFLLLKFLDHQKNPSPLIMANIVYVVLFALAGGGLCIEEVNLSHSGSLINIDRQVKELNQYSSLYDLNRVNQQEEAQDPSLASSKSHNLGFSLGQVDLVNGLIRRSPRDVQVPVRDQVILNPGQGSPFFPSKDPGLDVKPIIPSSDPPSVPPFVSPDPPLPAAEIPAAPPADIPKPPPLPAAEIPKPPPLPDTEIPKPPPLPPKVIPKPPPLPPHRPLHPPPTSKPVSQAPEQNIASMTPSVSTVIILSDIN